MKLPTKTLLGTAIAALLSTSLLASAPELMPSRVPAVAPKGSLAPQQEPSNQFIVKFRDGALSDAQRATALGAVSHSLGFESRIARRMAVGADVVVLSRRLDRVESESFLAQLRANPQVEYAIVDARMQALYTPNDTRYVEQWHYYNPPGGLNLPTAWNRSKGAGSVVAVIDTGITSHSELNANILPGYDFITSDFTANDANPGRDNNPADTGDAVALNECGSNDAANSSWHGTHVAGTVAAITGNSAGVAGVAHRAKVVPVRVLGKCGGVTSDIADAIVWSAGGSVPGVPANPNPAEVINMSLGGGSACDPATQAAVNAAVALGTVVVVAAGNSNSSVANFTPASCNNLISVASNDQDKGRSSFSNAGPLIDVAAPGGSPGILSTLNTGTTAPAAEGYAFYQGTSMASPHVAGVVALMQSAHANTPARVEELLKLTASPIPDIDCPGLCGRGVINPTAALAAVDGTVPLPPATILRNGVGSPVAAGGSGSDERFTLATYNGVNNLTFKLTQGVGNTNLYVRFGAAPTTETFDCRSNNTGTLEDNCAIASPQVGTYYVLVKGVGNHSGARVSGKHGSRTFVNRTKVHIPDSVGTYVSSPILVHSRPGNAPAAMEVSVWVYHTFIGDLTLELKAPDGTVYLLHDEEGGSADNIVTTYTVDASAELANGTWTLRAKDSYGQDVGHIDRWQVKM